MAAWLVSRNTSDPNILGHLLGKLSSTKYSQNQSQQLLNSFDAFSMFNLPLTASLDWWCTSSSTAVTSDIPSSSHCHSQNGLSYLWESINLFGHMEKVNNNNNNEKKDLEFSSILLCPQKCLKTFVQDLHEQTACFSRLDPCTCCSLPTDCCWTRASTNQFALKKTNTATPLYTRQTLGPPRPSCTTSCLNCLYILKACLLYQKHTVPEAFTVPYQA